MNNVTRRIYCILLLYIQGGCMRSSISYIETKENNPDSANKNKNKKQKQMYFLICESCLWCASAQSLRPIRKETTPKCPLCNGNRISIIPILRG